MRSQFAVKRWWWVIVLLIVTVDIFHPVHASNVLDDIGAQYKSASSGWESKLADIAKGLFIKLATLELIWSALMWVIARDDPEQMFASFVKKILGLSFFWAILLNFSTWIPAVIDGFSQAGRSASGLSALTPSAVLDLGLEISTGILNKVSDVSFSASGILTAFTAAFAGILIVVSFTVIAAQLLVTLIESYIAISAGVLFLGFAGSRWTTTFSEKYISYAVGIGVKLFVTYLIIAAGQTVSQGWVQLIVDGMKAKDYLPIMGGALVYTFLAWQIPATASSMMSGSPSMTLGGAAATAAGAVASAAGAAGMVGASVAGAAGGVAGLGNMAAGSVKAALAGGANATANGATGPAGVALGAAKAIGGAMMDSAGETVKGLGQNSAGGRMAGRIDAKTAALNESNAGAGGNGVQPSAPTTGADGESGSGAVGGSAQGNVIDTNSSLSQALAERDAVQATRATPPAPAPAAGGQSTGNSTSGSSATATGGQGVSQADASGGAQQSGQSANSSASNNRQQPDAPKKTTMERLADSARAMGQTPNDSGGNAAIQIDMKHSH
ncbi:P-type conjugative transfer protein TrbL [Pandoraea cepalis]|uniref:P-type conjugative transfer protein TrbL n=1 Tax=Pandoraea cepalis TaxID=2508294 RepID=A0AAW7MH75_9BURK|nr:P-type conjugative transfer protein TrbL [Pandoraea cepalis]MDN4572045.1 P-type conjugative transfer protein TrbL [Pandoraea cepalis]MDN4578891.1 P-type conjugative transfer protein TrbL [Pandoraea cepalis]